MNPTAWYATESPDRPGTGASACRRAPMPSAATFTVVNVWHALGADRRIGRPKGLGGGTG